MLVNKMNLLKKGHQAIFNFDCRINVSTFLNASEERDKQAGNQGVKKKQQSLSKKKRNALRAAKFREKSRLQNSEISFKSQSQSEDQNEIPKVAEAVTNHPVDNGGIEAATACEGFSQVNAINIDTRKAENTIINPVQEADASNIDTRKVATATEKQAENSIINFAQDVLPDLHEDEVSVRTQNLSIQLEKDVAYYKYLYEKTKIELCKFEDDFNARLFHIEERCEDDAIRNLKQRYERIVAEKVKKMEGK